MATLGELMAKLKGEGADADPLRPEGTGSSPYSGIDHNDQNGDSVAGTYENNLNIAGTTLLSNNTNQREGGYRSLYGRGGRKMLKKC